MNVNLELLNQIFQVCVIPLLAVLTTYLVKYIETKRDEIITEKNNTLAEKYIKMLSDTITDCVKATNQTYVDSLKDKNAFILELLTIKTWKCMINHVILQNKKF